LRLGKATASKIQSIVARTKSGTVSAGRKNYTAQLVLERLTGQHDDSGFKSAAMDRGNEVEEQARQAYSFLNSIEVTEASFIDHPTIKMSGCSPDGLAGAVGLTEFKCPEPAQHLATLTGAAIPLQYLTQIHWQMACMPERQWCDYVSFDPRFPQAMRLKVQRIMRDEPRIAELEREVEKFLFEVDEAVEKLQFQFAGQTDLAA
jgi:hypothetical protein